MGYKNIKNKKINKNKICSVYYILHGPEQYNRKISYRRMFLD
jgi:hypothetical protein